MNSQDNYATLKYKKLHDASELVGSAYHFFTALDPRRPCLADCKVRRLSEQPHWELSQITLKFTKYTAFSPHYCS